MISWSLNLGLILSEDQRAGLSATASILRAPVCARLAPDHCLMHRGQTPPASNQRCDSRGMLWLQMKGEQSQCPEEQSGLRRVVRPKEARRAAVSVLWAGAPDLVGCAVDRVYLSFIRQPRRPSWVRAPCLVADEKTLSGF